MTHRWIEPRTGAEERSDDPPGPGWLAVVTLNMPDGTPVASTPADLAEYLAQDHEASHDSFRNVIIMDFPDRPAYDSFANGRVAGTILACPYFLMEVIEDDDEGVVAEIVMDPNATSLPPEEVIDFEDTDRDTILVVPGGGGGGGRPTPPPVIPWNDDVPFPGDPDESAPAPSDEPLEPSDDMPSPDDSDVDLEQAAKDQADTDMGMKPDPDGDIEHPDGAPTDKPGDMPGGADPGEAEAGGDGDQPCSECNGTGEMPSDEDGDDGDEEGDDDGAGGDDGLDDEEQLLKELLEGDENGDQPGDSDSDSDSGSDSDSDEEGPGKKSSGDGDEEGSNKCTSCDGTGQQPSDDGDDGDDDGDDDDEDDSEDLPGLVEATNATIEATNAAIDGYASGMDLDEVEALIASAVASAKLAHSLAEPRSVIQRSVLRKAVEAAKRALDLDALMERDR